MAADAFDGEAGAETAYADALDADGRAILWRRRPADLDTPVGAYMKLRALGGPTFLLESVIGGESRGRYSVIGVKPEESWRLDGRKTVRTGPNGVATATEDPIASLKSFLADQHARTPEGAPPMLAGAFGYLGYDVVRLLERLPAPPPDALGLPDALLVRPSLVAVFDDVAQEIWLATLIKRDGETDEATARALGEARLDDAERALAGPVPDIPEAPGDPEAPVQDLVDDATFRTNVERIKTLIAAGDIFQAVPSRRFALPFPKSALSFYRALRRMNPSPFLLLFEFEDFSLIGSSPEIMVRVRDGLVEVRPIAGTRPRGKTRKEDESFASGLLADPKERAEHLMLVDLGRNDVARSAKPGTVKVTESFVIERYSHVMHIVSHVEGEMRGDVDAVDALFHGFPAGTVSGAPKIRAMEIIDAVETVKRGPYAGAVGYFSASGAMDSCIALRTAVLKDGVLNIQAGAGVVADSDPQAEADETRQKAEALIAAARLALREE